MSDLYFRTDSPYTMYAKTGASTWSEIYRAGGTDVAVADGGTGLSSYTTGQLLYASGSGTLAGLSDVATGAVLASGGVGAAPAYTASPTVTTLTGSTSLVTPTLTSSGALNITTASAGNLTLAPAGDVILNPTGNDILPTTGYDLNLGSLTTKFLTLHAAELWVETLVAQDTMATIGGRILIGPTTVLTADLADGASTMTVKHNQIASGDRVVLQAAGKVEWINVTSGPSGSAGAYVYSIGRDLDSSGANDWSAGDAVFNTGTTGDGFIDLYSVSGVIPGSTAGPTIVGQVRTGTVYSNLDQRWAIGNLNGTFNYGTDVYGAAFGAAGATNVTVDATNGFRIRNGTTDKLVADTSGNLALTGNLTVGTSGILRSGATSYASGTGYVLDYNAGTPRMRIGTTSGDRLAWDGSALELVSTNLTIDSDGIRITPGTAETIGTAFSFDTGGTGGSGLFGREDPSTIRQVRVASEWAGSGDYAGQIGLSLQSRHTPSSGGTSKESSIFLGSSSSSSTMDVTAETTNFSTDLQVRTDNGTTSTIPYIRGNGSQLYIESRSAANGGSLSLNNDQNSNVFIAFGGGSAFLNNARFTGAPLWESGLSQSTVGASGAASALPALPAGYLKVNINGTPFVVPYFNP